MGLAAADNSKWFYRIDGKIYGPSDIHEILKYLADGNLQVTTEVSQDNSSYKCLCDEPFFEDIIKRMLEQKRTNNPENSSPSGRQKIGKDFDVASMAASITSQLEEAEIMSRANFESATLRKILQDIQVQRQNAPIVVPDSTLLRPARTLEYDMTSYRKSKGGPRISWKKLLSKFSVAAIFGIVGFAAFTFYTIQKERFRQEELKLQQDFVKLALQAKSLGDYSKSLEEFRRAGQNPSVDSAIWYEFAEAAMRQGQFEIAQQYAERAADTAQNPAERSKALVVLGMNAFGRQDLERAIKFYEKALSATPESIPALFGLALVHLQNKNMAEAHRLLQDAIKGGVTEAPVLLAMTETAITLDGAAKEVGRVTEVDRLLEDYGKRRDDYKFEMVLAQLRIAAFRKDQKRVAEKLAAFLSVNPDIHTRQMRPFELSQARLDGRNLYSWCLETYAAVTPKTPALNGMIALCLFRNGDVNEALKFSKAASEASPKDPVLTGLYGYFLTYTGQGARAFEEFEKTKRLQPSKLELMTRATVCEKSGSWGCAIENWKKVQAADPAEMAAVEGLAKIYMNESRYDEVKQLVKKGLDRYPNLTTLQKISRQLP